MPEPFQSTSLPSGLQEITSNPDLVGGGFGAFAEDLEFPLALGHFRVDAFMVDAGVEAEIQVGVHDFAGDVAHGVVADPGVVFALRSREAAFGETEGDSVLIEEVFLLEAEPSVRIVQDGRATVRGMRGSVRQKDFAHHKHAIFLGAVRVNRHRLEHAVRAVPFGLPGGAAVESPQG